ncbi:MAG: HepT-like ribonuclease domain-containing protein [Acidimicrobiales bacterium]
MPRDPRTYLWDARRAADQIRAFVEGRSWQEYQADVLLHSAVERQFEIIGEALSQSSRQDGKTARSLGGCAPKFCDEFSGCCS